MDSTKLNDWIQSITGIAILIGLVLVVWELQQNREATQSQLTTEGWHMINQLHTSVLGDSPADALARACDDPASLTTTDLVVLDHYFTEILNHRIIRLQTLSYRGSFFADDYWRSSIGQWYRIFSSPAGRAWWRGSRFEGELRAFGDEVLANWKPRPCGYPGWKPDIIKEVAASNRAQ